MDQQRNKEFSWSLIPLIIQTYFSFWKLSDTRHTDKNMLKQEFIYLFLPSAAEKEEEEAFSTLAWVVDERRWCPYFFKEVGIPEISW